MKNENIFKLIFFPSEQTVEKVYLKLDRIIDKFISKDSPLRKFATPAIIIYLVVGTVTTVINLGVYYLLYYVLGCPDDKSPLIQVINTVAWIVAVVACFYPNKFYVFRSIYRGAAHTFKEFISFVVSRLATLIMETVGLFIFCTLLSLDARIIKLLLAVLVVIGNYVLGKIMVFRKGKN